MTKRSTKNPQRDADAIREILRARADGIRPDRRPADDEPTAETTTKKPSKKETRS